MVPTIRSAFAGLVVLVLTSACHSSSPALVRSWGFSGTVTQVWDPGDILQGSAWDGMKMTGHFGTTTTTDVDSHPQLGHFDDGDAWILAPGFGANPNGDFDFFTWNNAVSVPGDLIRVDQLGDPSDFVISSVDLDAKGVKRVAVRIELEDGSANALAGDHLPTHLDVDHWDSARFWITASTWSHGVWYVLGRIDEIWEE
jgi:hypothetical protein